MSDLSASERRLLGALDRIDRSIDALRARQAEAPAAAPGADDAPTVGAEPTHEAARLAAANDELAAANRALIDALAGKGGAEDGVRHALEAEIAALQAARAAEVAQLRDVLDALEALTGRAGAADAVAPDEAGEAAGDLSALPEGGLPRTAEAAPLADPPPDPEASPDPEAEER